MKNWYREYWAQTWYRNSYLVRRPQQIARGTNHDQEWNNLYDSGCNFTCLAMIVGIDPARLASELSLQSFFRSDRSLRAKYINGREGHLVWDQNEPGLRRKSVTLRNIWHSHLRKRATVTIRFERDAKKNSYAEAKRFIRDSRAKGRHIICGPQSHSHLVAGTIKSEFFVWDPDELRWPIEDSLRGRVTLKRVFELCAGRPIEFSTYSVKFK